MANFSTNQFKAGLKLMIDGEPCNIIDNEIVKPGKGQAFNRIKIRKLIIAIILLFEQYKYPFIIVFVLNTSSILKNYILIKSPFL